MSDVTALLAEAAWLTRLARSLVGSDDADDIVQETYAAALRTPPDPDRPARPWLRRVMVNVVRMRHRGRVRRGTREGASTLAEPVRTPEQLLERARVERTLADVVIALEEPLRTTLLLRYREGLTAEAIAAQLALSVATVRRRLSEAVEQLRRGLDERETNKTWRAAFAPFLVGREPSPPWWSVVMAKAASKILLVALALVLLVVGGGVAIRRVTRTPDPGRQPSLASRRPADGVPVGRLAHVFAQPGVRPQPLVGRVTLAEHGFEGAQVRVTHALTREVIAEVTTGSDGGFTVSDIPSGAMVVSASTKDRTAMPVTVDMRSPAARGQTIELRLIACLHVRGIVSDGSGAPIAHARVAPEVSQVPFADTDALGHYEVCARPGLQTLRFSASGYNSVVVDIAFSGDSIQDATLLPEAVIAGVVVDTDNRPVANAAITVDPHALTSTRSALVVARSAPDGTFRISGVAPGRGEIYAEAPSLMSRRVELVLGAGETREGLILHLDHAPRLTGTVSDSHGQKQSGASIGLRIGSTLREGLAVSQADGSFVIERVPKGTHSIVIANYEVSGPREVTIGSTDVAVQITADALPFITGIVTRGGAPLPNAVLQCPWHDDVSGAPVSDGHGAFSCPLSVEGPFSVYASDDQGRFGSVDGTWTRGKTLMPLTIEVDQAGAICGTVSDPSGAKLRGIRVVAENPTVVDSGESTSDDAGTYCIRQLRNEGTFEITVWSGGQKIAPDSPLPRVTLAKGQATLPIVVASPDQEIAGLIVDDVGAPVPDASIRASAEAYSSSSAEVAVADSSGRFAIHRLAAGSYRVLATARDGASKTVNATAGTRDLTIVLDRAGSVEGTLVGFAHQPSILGISMGTHQDAVAFELDGDHFRAHGLPPGIYSISASTNGHEADSVSVAVDAGKVTTVTLTSRGNASLDGHVVDWLTKRPVPNARCAPPLPRSGDKFGVFMRAFEIERATDAGGAFHFDDVTAGEISIPCDAGTTHATRIGTIVAGSKAQLDVFVAFPKSGGGDIGNLEWTSRTMLNVQPNAAKAGLQVGDVVIGLDNQPVELLDGGTIHAVISNHPVGSQLSIAVRRGAMVIPLEITL